MQPQREEIDASFAPPWVLASASPRRAALLSAVGQHFEVEPSRVRETSRERETAAGCAARLAREKALEVSGRRRARWVLGADTLVVADGVSLGKPGTASAAAAMLRRLSGRTHEVVTAFALVDPAGRVFGERVVVSEVRFRRIEPAEVDAYVAGGEPLDKAGGYAIQGGAAAFVAELRGSHTNVVGLPMAEVEAMLRAAGLWRAGARRVTSPIGERYRAVVERVGEAAERCGRRPQEVTVVAAAKTFGVEAVREVIAAGATDIGENYVQEARRKAKDLPRDAARWHMIGRLQRNKAAQTVTLFHLVHSLDRPELARELDRSAFRAGVRARCLVEVNLAGEPSKGGADPGSLDVLLEQIAPLRHLEVLGLMSIPAPGTLDESRRSFARLRALRERLAGLRLPNVRLKELSMGMSADFEAAIEEGATIVRIGSAIFGPRTGG